MAWNLIEEERKSAYANMQQDADLLAKLAESNQPILHLYDWQQDSATYGHFINPDLYLDLAAVEQSGLELARRPTGGGIIFHNCDLAFSVLIPASHPRFSQNTLDNYAFVNRKVILAIQNFLHQKERLTLLADEPHKMDEYSQVFCMAKPTKYDVMMNGKKVGGAAQRKTRAGFLHQGSISLAKLPDEYLKKVLKPNTLVLDSMRQNGHALISEELSKQDLDNARYEMRTHLKQIFLEEL